jgi:MFS family permease
MRRADQPAIDREADQRKIAFALYRLAVNLGMSIGPLLGGLLVTHLSYDWLFWIDGATTILAGLVFSFAHWVRPIGLWEGVGEEPATASASPLSAYALRRAAGPASAWVDLRLVYFMIAIIPVAMVFFQFEGALPLFMVRELGLSESVRSDVSSRGLPALPLPSSSGHSVR